MTISFNDNKNNTRILNLNRINQISYDEGSRYFMVYFNNDTDTFTFRNVEYRDKILAKIREMMNTEEL